VGLLYRVDRSNYTWTSSQKYMDLRAGPDSLEQVEWIHLLQWLHWIEVLSTSWEQTEQGYLGFVEQTGVGLWWTLPLESRKRRIRRRFKEGEQNRVRLKRKKRVAVQLRPVSGWLNKKMKSR